MVIKLVKVIKLFKSCTRKSCRRKRSATTKCQVECSAWCFVVQKHSKHFWWRLLHFIREGHLPGFLQLCTAAWSPRMQFWRRIQRRLNACYTIDTLPGHLLLECSLRNLSSPFSPDKFRIQGEKAYSVSPLRSLHRTTLHQKQRPGTILWSNLVACSAGAQEWPRLLSPSRDPRGQYEAGVKVRTSGALVLHKTCVETTVVENWLQSHKW